MTEDPIHELDSDDNQSPFKPPNDEEVFLTRENEKQKKKEAVNGRESTL